MTWYAAQYEGPSGPIRAIIDADGLEDACRYVRSEGQAWYDGAHVAWEDGEEPEQTDSSAVEEDGYLVWQIADERIRNG